MDFIIFLGGCPKASLIEYASFIIGTGNSIFLGKEGHCLLFSARLFLIAWIQTMGAVTNILKLKAITTLSIQIFKGPLFDYMCFKLG